MRLNEMTVMLNEENGTYLASQGYRPCLSRERLNSPEQVAQYMRDTYGADRLADERLWMICADAKMKPVGIFEVSRGYAQGSIVPVRELMRDALMANAINVMLVHNHPSGDPMPSTEDVSSTKNVGEAAKLVGITLLDHVIVGSEGRYASLKLDGYL